MKKIGYILVLVSLFVSCDEVLEEVSFKATLDEENVYEAGREIRFNFSGNPDYITFYSGESGCKYEYAGQLDEEGTANFGIAVKSMSAREDSFVHTYAEAGDYEAVFVAKNITFEGSNEVSVRLKVSIADATDDSEVNGGSE